MKTLEELKGDIEELMGDGGVGAVGVSGLPTHEITTRLTVFHARSG